MSVFGLGVGLVLVAAPAWAARVPQSVADQLESELAACKVRLEDLKDRSDRCSEDSPPPLVYTELVQTLANTEVEVLREGPRVMVVLPGEMLFSPGSLTVRHEALFAVDFVGTALRLHPELHAWVVGHVHAGPVPRTQARVVGDHLGLAFAEARALRDRMVELTGVGLDRFTLSSRGATEPLTEGDSPAGRAKNHRVVVVLGPHDPWR